MKNYLYILCAFLLAFAGCTKDADENLSPLLLTEIRRSY